MTHADAGNTDWRTWSVAPDYIAPWRRKLLLAMHLGFGFVAAMSIVLWDGDFSKITMGFALTFIYFVVMSYGGAAGWLQIKALEATTWPLVALSPDDLIVRSIGTFGERVFRRGDVCRGKHPFPWIIVLDSKSILLRGTPCLSTGQYAHRANANQKILIPSVYFNSDDYEIMDGELRMWLAMSTTRVSGDLTALPKVEPNVQFDLSRVALRQMFVIAALGVLGVFLPGLKMLAVWCSITVVNLWLAIVTHRASGIAYTDLPGLFIEFLAMACCFAGLYRAYQ